MKSSPWTVLVLGIVGVGLLMLGMCATLHSFRQSPQGERLRLANSIREQFQFDSVVIEVRQEEHRSVWVITYETRKELQSDPDALEAELKSVGEFVFQHLGQEEIDEALVLRQEKRPPGSDPLSLQNEFRVENPMRKRRRRS